MAKRLLIGNEAFAYAALESGISVAAGCPGYPSTEIIETCAKLFNKGRAAGLHVEWSSNEATALGVCAAASMSGLRSLFSCKSAGLNVASDVLMSLSYTGVRGGLVMCIADDPGATSSAVEQDTRVFAAFAKIPVLDPATPEQGFTMMKRAFELSEATQRPVILRTTTRICLTSTFFNVDSHFEALPPRTSVKGAKGFAADGDNNDAIAGFVHNPKRWSIYPSDASSAETIIATSLDKISHTYTYDTIFASFNPLYLNGQLVETAFEEIKGRATVGIVTSGDSATCVLEALEMLTRSIKRAGLQMPDYRFIQIGTPYPFPHRTLTRFFKDLKHVLVIEQLSSFIEEELLKIAGTRFLAPTIHGKLTDEAQRFGELTIEDTLYKLAHFFDEYASPDKTGDAQSYLNNAKDGADELKNARAKRGASSSENPIADRLAVLHKRTSYTDIVDHMAGPGAFYNYSKKLPARNPILCAGCPHRGSLYAIKETLSRMGIPRLDTIISGDLGCQLLGSADPLDMIDASLCLGASSALSQGFAQTNPHKKSIALIGDSSLISNSLPAIENAVHNEHDVAFIVLNNSVNALDRLQPDAFSQCNILKSRTHKVDAAELLRALGVKAVHKADPLKHVNAEDACAKAIQFTGPSAVIFESPCALLAKSDRIAFVNIFKCTGCKKCIVELGCPAIKYDPDAKGPKSGRRGQAIIDPDQCNGCGLCTQVCAYQAIKIYRRDAVPSFEPAQKLDPKTSPLNNALDIDLVDTKVGKHIASDTHRSENETDVVSGKIEEDFITDSDITDSDSVADDSYNDVLDKDSVPDDTMLEDADGMESDDREQRSNQSSNVSDSQLSNEPSDSASVTLFGGDALFGGELIIKLDTDGDQ